MHSDSSALPQLACDRLVQYSDMDDLAEDLARLQAHKDALVGDAIPVLQGLLGARDGGPVQVALGLGRFELPLNHFIPDSL